MGIIGKNGSGKSTLLRLIAGIYQPDSGNIKVDGKIISLINLSIGMQERLTILDNIYLCCSIFDISNRDIANKVSSILQFAELKDYANTQLYQLSLGMKHRLAFSIAINCNPEILLLDEVFEVGDEDFKKKSSEKIKEIVKKGGTVLLVSHELEMIKKYCNKVIWMEKGKILKSGNTLEIIKEYLKCPKI